MAKGGFLTSFNKKLIHLILLALFCIISLADTSQAITITGPETVTTNSNSAYIATDCNGSVTWSVTGTGASISSNGVLTTSSVSCGGVTVSARCGVGVIASKVVRVSDRGYWQLLGSTCPVQKCGWTAWGGVEYFYVGIFQYECRPHLLWKQAWNPYYGLVCNSDLSCGNVEFSYQGQEHFPASEAPCFSCEDQGGQILLPCVIKYEWKCPTCTNGQTIPCYTGTGGTQGVGLCRSGTQTCTNGQWGACAGEILPSSEVCNDSLDNNCNGQVDEGCSIVPPKPPADLGGSDCPGPATNSKGQ